MWLRLSQVDLSTVGLLAGYELEVDLSWEPEIVRCELAPICELIGLLLVDTSLTDARLGEVLDWDQLV